jgi:transposase
MDRAEAQAIYDSGREACVEFILELAGRVGQHDDRLSQLEQQARQDSHTSSKPPSQDPPKTRAQRRAEARAKAKELMRKEGERRAQGGQPGHRGAGRELKPSDRMDEIVDHYPEVCGGCGRGFAPEQQRPGGRFGRHQVAELPPIGVIFRSIARTSCAVGTAAHGPAPACPSRSAPRRSGCGCRRRW